MADPILTSEMVERLALQVIDLSDTDATEAQFSEVYDTRGGKSLATIVEASSGTGNESVDVNVLTRVAVGPWLAIPAIETRSDTPGAIFSEGTLWPTVGQDANGRGLPTTWLDLWAALLSESVVVCQPEPGDTATLEHVAVVLSNQVWSFESSGAPPSSGSAKLTFRGDTTTAIQWNATAADVAAALALLPSIGAGNVIAQPGNEGNTLATYCPFVFVGALGGQAVEAPTISDDTMDVAPQLTELDPGGVDTMTGGGLTFTAYVGGDWGNALAVQFVDPGEADQPMRVSSEDGYTLVVSLATDSDGVIVTTTADVQKALAGDVLGFAPFAILTTKDTDGLVAATDPLPLTGGTSNATAVTYRVRGSI